MSILLTEQEVDAIHPIIKSFPEWRKEFARAIQLALIEKLRKELPPTYIFPNQMNEQRLVCIPTPQELEND